MLGIWSDLARRQVENDCEQNQRRGFGMNIILAVIALAVGWVVCGVMAYGITFGHFQNRWPELAEKERDIDIARAKSIAVTGPIGLVVSFFASGCCHWGFKWR
jgi:ABC-type transporter Mla maintaining outer membrane lipid asymmetry permease subunit MlaE